VKVLSPSLSLSSLSLAERNLLSQISDQHPDARNVKRSARIGALSTAPNDRSRLESATFAPDILDVTAAPFVLPGTELRTLGMHKSHKQEVTKERVRQAYRARPRMRARDLQAAALKSVPVPSILNRWDQSPCNLRGF